MQWLISNVFVGGMSLLCLFCWFIYYTDTCHGIIFQKIKPKIYIFLINHKEDFGDRIIQKDAPKNYYVS